MRRRTFTAALASSVLAGPLPAYAAHGDLRLRLPAPTGRWRVGTTTRHLIDRDRSDPWNNASTRDIMTTLFYPATVVRGYPLAAQLTPAAAEVFKGLDAGILHSELPADGVDWAATMTHSHVDAPAPPARRPVLLYSPGGADPRTIGTSVAEDLASHGYVVITIDHPGETSEVEFPGGRLRTIEVPPEVRTDPVLSRKMMTTRFADVRFVLDQLRSLDGPPLDLRRIGIYGHSAGGATAAVSLDDRRIRAAANLEGYLDTLDGELYPIAQHGTDKPLLLAGTDGFRDARFDRTWAAVMSHGGPVRRVELHDANHWVFTDYAALTPQLQSAGLVTPEARARLIGSTPYGIHAVRKLVRTFFAQALGSAAGALSGR
ncbi:alpha/beta hydrolase [Kribbella sp. NPDC023972]|uniref:alpha/beta hydrolase family protein n=1 Tax=Kribbella sp. NPDC023972 TaxID=3154795 RepID=UPI0033C205DD